MSTSSIELAPLKRQDRIKSAEGIAHSLYNITENALKKLSRKGPSKYAEELFYKHIASNFIFELAFILPLAVATKIPGLEQRIADKKDLLDSISVGEHMNVDVMKYRGKNLSLSDGTTVSNEDIVGQMHFYRNLPQLRNNNIIAYTRDLYESASESLKSLARRCQKEDPRLSGVTAFYGESHIAGPLAKRLGFDIYDINNPLYKLFVYYGSKNVVDDTTKESRSYRAWKENFKPPRQAYISRAKLVELFGEKPKEPVPELLPEVKRTPFSKLAAIFSKSR